MEISEVRLRNLQTLVRTYGSAKEFCAAAGIDPTYLSQLKSGTKKLGNTLARTIEQRMGFQRGALDDASRAAGDVTGHAVTAVAHALESLPHEVRSHLTGLIFELAKKQMDTSPVSGFDIRVRDEESGHEQSPEVPAARRR